MFHTQIKILALACLIGITGSTYCANNSIQNDTDGDIIVFIGYGFCESKSIIIQAHRQDNFFRACCAQTIDIRASNGKANGQTYYLNASPSNSNKTCLDLFLRVYIAEGNVLKAELRFS
jgi:hypothetical protein